MDPQLSLAFSMHSNKGVYALLLGSGLSSAAGIPTGWDIVKDLIRRLARLQGANCGDKPDVWYRETFQEDANYSKLLDNLARTPAERRELLRHYFEPTAEEKEQGKKVPTKAHRAIAWLMARGYVRVVVTTNFDRLLEHALDDEGVRPDVVDTPDKVLGVRPLVHSPATIIKLHGDYADERIKNTLAELASYEAPMNGLLDRVLDEYGLVVSGWSATWDPALRAALERCSNRRYAAYWTTYGKPSEEAERLIQHRRAEALPITAADAFFVGLQEKVESLESFEEQHPMSAELAVATLKRYLVSDAHRIRLQELVDEETEKAFAAATPTAGMVRIQPAESTVRAHAQRMHAASDTLVQFFMTGCYWGERHHQELWVRVLQRLLGPFEAGGFPGWNRLVLYPAQLLFHAGSLAALSHSRYSTLAALYHAPTRLNLRDETESAVALLNGLEGVGRAEWLPGGDAADGGGTWRLPTSERLFRVLRPYLQDFVRADEVYERLFNRHEYLVALATAASYGVNKAPPCRFTVNRPDDGESVFKALDAEIDAQKNAWPPIAEGLVRATYAKLVELRPKLRERLHLLAP